MSEVHRNYEAVAQNLRLRTRKRGPEGEHSPTRQDEKNNLLDCLTFSLFSFSAMRSLTSFVTSAAGRGLPGLKQIGHHDSCLGRAAALMILRSFWSATRIASGTSLR